MAILLSEFLQRVQAQTNGSSNRWKCLCRSHDDSRHSLRVELAASGKLLLYCDVCRGQGKSQTDMLGTLKAEGLWPIDVGTGRSVQLALSAARSHDLKKDSEKLEWVSEPVSQMPTPREYAGLTVAAVHVYRTIAGKISGAVIRYHHQSTDRLGKPEKEFRPLFCFSMEGKETWRTKAPQPKPLYGLEKLKDRDKSILLVEGEKTANKAQEVFPNLIVLSAFGGLFGFQRTDISILANRDVIVWPDHDNNWRTALAAWVNKLAPEGRLAVRSLRTVTLPASLPEKWDLGDPIPDGIDVQGILQKSVLHEPCPDSVSNIQTLVQLEAGLYQVIDAASIKLMWRPTRVEYQPSSFDQQFNYLRNDMGNVAPHRWAATYTRTAKRQCVGRTYVPTNEVMVQVGGEMAYNMYLDPKIPALAGDVSIWQHFLEFLLGEEAAHLFNCPLANLMQHGHNHDRKCRYATILVGPQGIGKSIGLSVYEKLVGATNSSRPTTAEIEDRFNSYADGVQVINLVELSGSSQAYHRLMDVIADPEVRVHRKNLEAKTIKNFSTVIGSSNESEPIKILDETERRWLFLLCRATVAQRSSYDYERIVKWIEAHLPQLKYFYLNYDMMGWDSNKLPSYGHEVKRAIVSASLPHYEREYRDTLLGKFPPLDKDIFTKTRFQMLTMQWKMRNEKNLIRKYGGGTVRGLVRAGKGKRIEEIYIIRNLDRYQHLSEEEIGNMLDDRQPEIL